MKTSAPCPTTVAIALFLALSMGVACSPPTTQSSIAGRLCSDFGDQACSTEPGSPRAECNGFSWRILEYCGAQGCNTLQTSQTTLAYCGSTPPSVTADVTGGDTQPGKTDAGVDGKGDAKVDPNADASPAGGTVQCDGWKCAAGLVCSGVGGCEAPGCLPACGAGQRCVGKPIDACQDYCGGLCYEKQWCEPGLKEVPGSCATLPCSVPSLVSDTFVATAVVLAEGASAVAAHCKDPAAGYSLAGATGTVSQLTKVFGDLQNPTQAAAASGLQTIALTANGAGWAWLSTRRLTGAPCGNSPCQLVASKYDNLDSLQVPNGVCLLRSRNGSTGESKPWPLSLRNEFNRYDLLLRQPTVQMAPDRSEAWVCGTVTLESLQGALTSAYAAKGLAIPTSAELESMVPRDVDTNGDGKPDAWSVVLQLTLKPAAVALWSP